MVRARAERRTATTAAMDCGDGTACRWAAVPARSGLPVPPTPVAAPGPPIPAIISWPPIAAPPIAPTRSPIPSIVPPAPPVLSFLGPHAVQVLRLDRRSVGRTVGGGCRIERQGVSGVRASAETGRGREPADQSEQECTPFHTPSSVLASPDHCNSALAVRTASRTVRGPPVPLLTIAIRGLLVESGLVRAARLGTEQLRRRLTRHLGVFSNQLVADHHPTLPSIPIRICLAARSRFQGEIAG
ncbi:MAG: hypothetical protein K0Q60_1704 [Microvirga sp.]|nr:hypothetical protein [Microvirga sp.]